MAESLVGHPVRQPGILVWGAGAIGGTLGAYWTRAGHPVTLVDTDVSHVDHMKSFGLRIEGPIDEFVVRVHAVTPDWVRGRWGTVVLAVKAHHTAEALLMLERHLTDEGFVLSAQNGLNEIAIAKALGRERTMGCFVNFGADWLGPGRILYGNRGAVVVGEIDGAVRDRTRATHDLLKLFEPEAVLTDDIWGYLWGKLAYGAMLFGTALTDDSMSANFADPARLPAWLALGREVMAVATAEGVSPRGFGGFRLEAFAPGAPEAEARAVVTWLADYTSRTAKTHSGIHRDLAIRRRATEVDAQVGIVAAIGRARGVPTPALDRLVALIHAIERGERPLAATTLHALIAAC